MFFSVSFDSVAEDEVVIQEGGYAGLKEMLRYKNVEAQRDSLWTLATLAGNTELTHDGIVSEVGWPSILTRASAKVEDIQLPAVTIIANLCMNGSYPLRGSLAFAIFILH